MIKKIGVIIVLLIGLGFGIWGFENRLVEVIRIVDGDNIELSDGRRIRYINVDTAEKGECYREESIRVNEELVMGKKVRVELDVNEMDRFGRHLAYVWVGDKMINEELLRLGVGEYQLDTVNLKHQDRLMRAAEKGYEDGSGVWGECGNIDGCQIKGNLDKDDKRYYHLPGFRHYSQVIMRLDQGDRWFCSEEAAIEAGFKRARE